MKKLKYKDLYKYLRHRENYRLESGLLSIYCEVNDKSGYFVFWLEAECYLSLNESQEFYLEVPDNKMNSYILVKERNESVKIYL